MKCICGSENKVKFVKITDCNLCEECDDKLAESFELAMTEDRIDTPEL